MYRAYPNLGRLNRTTTWPSKHKRIDATAKINVDVYPLDCLTVYMECKGEKYSRICRQSRKKKKKAKSGAQKQQEWLKKKEKLQT